MAGPHSPGRPYGAGAMREQWGAMRRGNGRWPQQAPGAVELPIDRAARCRFAVGSNLSVVACPAREMRAKAAVGWRVGGLEGWWARGLAWEMCLFDRPAPKWPRPPFPQISTANTRPRSLPSPSLSLSPRPSLPSPLIPPVCLRSPSRSFTLSSAARLCRKALTAKPPCTLPSFSQAPGAAHSPAFAAIVPRLSAIRIRSFALIAIRDNTASSSCTIPNTVLPVFAASQSAQVRSRDEQGHFHCAEEG